MADGKILKNRGDGWKLHAKVKPGFTPEYAYAAAKQQAEEFLAKRPAFAEFKRAMFAEFSFSERFMVKAALEALSDDPDGAWVELNDMARISCDIETVVELCRLYNASCEEAKALKNEAAPA